MPAIYQTNVYDIYYGYDSDYDDTPIMVAYTMYKDVDGYWTTQTEDTVGIYRFNDDDVNWLIANLTDYNKQPYSSLKEFYIEEFYNSNSHELLSQLPPNAIEWLKSLPTYDYEDYSADTEER
nr:MAG TPA: hypothetical protein [Caudoviricetes sp.]